MYYIFKVNCQIFFQKNSLKHQRPCIRYILLFVLLLIYDEIQIALVRKDGLICKGNFIYTKLSKPPEMIFFLIEDENPSANNFIRR